MKEHSKTEIESESESEKSRLFQGANLVVRPALSLPLVDVDKIQKFVHPNKIRSIYLSSYSSVEEVFINGVATLREGKTAMPPDRSCANGARVR